MMVSLAACEENGPLIPITDGYSISLYSVDIVDENGNTVLNPFENEGVFTDIKVEYNDTILPYGVCIYPGYKRPDGLAYAYVQEEGFYKGEILNKKWILTVKLPVKYSYEDFDTEFKVTYADKEYAIKYVRRNLDDDRNFYAKIYLNGEEYSSLNSTEDTDHYKYIKECYIKIAL